MINMSGHSKWSQIKRDKATTDSKRGNLFTKISRLITVAVKKGGGDPNLNSYLRLAIEKAKESRMTKETIEKAIQRGFGLTGEGNFEELVYEGFGPNGEAFYITAISDNRNRTVTEIRSIFNKNGGTLGSIGSTSYIFYPDPLKPMFKSQVDNDKKDNLINILNQLQESDDIQQVFVNFDI